MTPNELRAYLASNQSDDDEAVTKDWLESVGFQRGGFGSLVYHSPYRTSIGLRVFMDGMATSLELPTRGHVRRLAVALGVPLKESKS